MRNNNNTMDNLNNDDNNEVSSRTNQQQPTQQMTSIEIDSPHYPDVPTSKTAEIEIIDRGRAITPSPMLDEKVAYSDNKSRFNPRDYFPAALKAPDKSVSLAFHVICIKTIDNPLKCFEKKKTSIDHV
ncbi:unnamed protein product [Didymodactylos carnosus]|uniref:Uncharacterized protein n=1 Tax=Didymodactylos carnosus TaxID=1234261 RepID=A0A813PIV0_9BILA|nr:unnamed protein product [Didymodactylos carnosus]CAF0751814.1 unnamed protein product [Didymodactylos carnosus]CAF3509572.1 unnamed protein product [Didymodactylos carnosus]CAF3531511.1 unnamed protein product [Didymodactylos carnosus]